MYNAVVTESKFHAALGLPRCLGPPKSARRPGPPISARPQASERPCSVLSLPAPTPPPTKLAEPWRPPSRARQSPLPGGPPPRPRPSSAGLTCRQPGFPSPRKVKPAKQEAEVAEGEPIQEGEQEEEEEEEEEEPGSGEAAGGRAAVSYREAKIRLRICRLLGQEPTEAERAAVRATEVGLAPLRRRAPSPKAALPAAGAGERSEIVYIDSIHTCIYVYHVYVYIYIYI